MLECSPVANDCNLTWLSNLSDTFSPQNPDHCMVFCSVCDKQSDCVDDAGGTETSVRSKSVHFYNKREVLCLWFHTQSTKGQLRKKALEMLFASCLHI
jgi:hypothetical protein